MSKIYCYGIKTIIKNRTSALIIIALVLSCHKQPVVNQSLPSLPETNGYIVSVALNQNQLGYTIPENFLGFSYDTESLTTTSTFLNANNTVLIQLIKNMGNGVLRIGGTSSDLKIWTGKERSETTGIDSLTTTDIDNFSAFAKAVGWPVIFGLNLGKYSPSIAANEASYVSNSLQNNLYSLQFGNEPDIFLSSKYRPSNYTNIEYQDEWTSYYTAVKNAVPNAHFSGPDIAYNQEWITPFEATKYQNLSLLDGHYYRTGPATDATINHQTILKTDIKLLTYLETLNKASSLHNLPYRISECNSVYGGGKTGVSDVFASALWSLEFMWTVAENNGKGVNFHGGAGGPYSPIAVVNGMPTARPEYYAMLAFKYGGIGGKIVPTTVGYSTFNCSAHACINGGITFLTLINKDANNLSFNIQVNNPVTKVNISRLFAPSITSTTGITYAEHSVNADGTFLNASTENYAGENKTNLIINVAAGSAAVVMLK